MAYNEEVTMMMSVVPGAMTGISTMMGGLVSINNVFMDMTRQIDASFGLIDAGIITAGTVVAQFGFKAAEAFGQFQQGMKVAQMVSGQTSDDIRQLSKVANEFAVSYRTDIDQITEGLQTLGRAGLNSASEQTEVLKAGLSTAKLESRDLNSVLEELIQNTALLGGNLKESNFGESSEYLNNILVATSMTAPITTHDVSETLKYSGGIAAAAGANVNTEEGKAILEDYMGAIAAFAQKGVTGSIAGTALRAFFNKPATQDSSVTDALASIHLKPEYLWEDDEQTMKPVSEQIGIIQDQMDDLNVSTMDRLQIWSKIVGGKMGQQMMKLDSNSIKELTRDIQSANDAESLAAGTFQTFQSNMKEMSEQGQVAFRTFGERVTVVLNPLIDLATEFLKIFSNPAVSTGLFAGFLGFMNNVVHKITNVFSKLKSEISTIMTYLYKGDELYAMRPSTERKNNRYNTSQYTSPVKRFSSSDSSELFSYDPSYKTSNPFHKYEQVLARKELETFLNEGNLSVADANILRQKITGTESKGITEVLRNTDKGKLDFDQLQDLLSTSNKTALGIDNDSLSFLLKKNQDAPGTFESAIRYLQKTGQWDEKYTRSFEVGGFSGLANNHGKEIISKTLESILSEESDVFDKVQKNRAVQQREFLSRIVGMDPVLHEEFRKKSDEEKQKMQNVFNNALNKTYSSFGLQRGDFIDEHPEFLESFFGELVSNDEYADYFASYIRDRDIKAHNIFLTKTKGKSTVKEPWARMDSYFYKDMENIFFQDPSKISYNMMDDNPFVEGLNSYNEKRLVEIEKFMKPYLQKYGPHKLYNAEFSELIAKDSSFRVSGYPSIESFYEDFRFSPHDFAMYREQGIKNRFFKDMTPKEITEEARRLAKTEREEKKLKREEDKAISKDWFGHPMVDYDGVYSIPDDFKRQFYTRLQKGTLKDKDDLRFLSLLQLGDQVTTFGKHMGEDISVTTPMEWFFSDRDPTISDFMKLHMSDGHRLNTLIKNPKQQAEFFKIFMEKFNDRREVIENLIESEENYQKVLGKGDAILLSKDNFDKNFSDEKKVSLDKLKKNEVKDIARIFGIEYNKKSTKDSIIDDIKSDVGGGLYLSNNPQEVLGNINTGYLRQVKSFDEMRTIASFFGISDYTETESLSKKEAAEKMKNDVLKLVEKKDSVYVGKSSIEDIIIPEEYLLEIEKEKTNEIRKQNELLKEQKNIIEEKSVKEKSDKNPAIAENSMAFMGQKSLEVDEEVKRRWRKEHYERTHRNPVEDGLWDIDDPWGYKRYTENENNNFGRNYFDELQKNSERLQENSQEIKKNTAKEGTYSQYHKDSYDAALKRGAKGKINIRPSNPYEGYDEWYKEDNDDDGEEYPFQYLGYKDGKGGYQDFKNDFLKEQEAQEKEMQSILDKRNRLSRLESISNPFSGWGSRINEALFSSDRDSLLRTKGSAKELSNTAKFGNLLSKGIDLAGGPLLLAIEGVTMAIQMWQQWYQEYTEGLKTAMQDVKEAYSERDSAESSIRRNLKEQNEDITDEELDEQVYGMYTDLYKNLTENQKKYRELASHGASTMDELEYDEEKDDGSYKKKEEEIDEETKNADELKKNTAALYAATSQLNFALNTLQSKMTDTWWGLDGWTGAITNALGKYQDTFKNWGEGSSFLEEGGKFLLTAQQKDENYSGYTEMAGLMLEDFKDSGGDWRKGLTTMMGKDADFTSSIMREDAQTWMDSMAKLSSGQMGGLSSGQNARLQASMKYDQKSWNKLAKDIAKFESKNKKTYGSTDKRTTKKIEGQIDKLRSTLGEGFDRTRVLQAAYLEIAQGMFSVAQTVFVPLVQQNAVSAAQAVSGIGGVHQTVDGTGSSTYNTAAIASSIAAMLGTIALAQAGDAAKTQASLGVDLDNSGTAGDTQEERNLQDLALNTNSGTEFMNEALKRSQGNSFLMNAGNWLEQTSGNVAIGEYLKSRGKLLGGDRSAADFLAKVYGVSTYMSVYGMDSEAATKKYEEWYNTVGKNAKPEDILKTLGKNWQFKGFVDQIEQAYLNSGEEGEGNGGGSGSGSGNKDKDNTGTRKERVDLVLCSKKEIPKLNVNLFKKPPTFTVLNKNFKVRDVKINTEDTPKAIMSAIKNSFIDVQKRSDPKIIQDEDAVYDPEGSTEGNPLPSGTAKTRTD